MSVVIRDQKTELSPPETKEKPELSASISEKKNKISESDEFSKLKDENHDFLKGVRESELMGTMEKVVDKGTTDEAGIGWEDDTDSDISTGNAVEVIFKKNFLSLFFFSLLKLILFQKKRE